ncbi:hypothetical protein [Peribacillus loiseleuriae]
MRTYRYEDAYQEQNRTELQIKKNVSDIESIRFFLLSVRKKDSWIIK